MEELRLKGFADLSAVKYATLETNGQISVLPYARRQPPAAALLGVEPEEGGLPLAVVSDGKVNLQALARLGLDRAWLEAQLARRGLSGPEAVFFLTVDEAGTVFLVEKEGAE